MGQYGNVTRKFADLFKQALTDKTGQQTKTKDKQWSDYAALTSYIHELKRADQISACLDEYLKTYTKYPTEDRRSKFIFAILLKDKIEKTKVGDKFIDEIFDILTDTQRPFAFPLRLRYEDLEPNEKTEIKGLLLYKRESQKQRRGILGALSRAYFKRHQQEPSLQDLWNYGPMSDNSELEKTFKEAKTALEISWSKNEAQSVAEGVEAFVDFLAAQKDCLNLFQVLKWCRDVVWELPIQAFTRKSGEAEVQTRAAHTALESEYYVQTAYLLFIYAIKHGYSQNFAGFTQEELTFIFEPLAKDYWFENYYNRYKLGTTNRSTFREASILFMRLLIFARMNDADWLNNKDASKMRTLISNGGDELEQRSFQLEIGPEIFRGKVKIGDQFGQVCVIYFDKVDTNVGRVIYVEFDNMENLLFRTSVSQLSKFNVDNFYTQLWLNTRHLLKLIPLIFKSLGYTFSFITGGFSAMVVDIVVDVSVDEFAEAAKLGPEATFVLSMAAGVTSGAAMSKLDIGKPKLDTSMIDSTGTRGFANIADEAKALARVETTAGSADARLGAQVDKDFLDRATKVAATDERSVGKAAAGVVKEGEGEVLDAATKVSRGGRARPRDGGGFRTGRESRGAGWQRYSGIKKDTRFRKPSQDARVKKRLRREERGHAAPVDRRSAATKARKEEKRAVPVVAKKPDKSASSAKSKSKDPAKKGKGGGDDAESHKATDDRGTKERLGGDRGKKPAQRTSSEAALNDPGHPAALQYLANLTQRFPKLAGAGVRLIRRNLGEPGLWEEAVFTGSAPRLSMTANLRTPRAYNISGDETALWKIQREIQMDDINRKGFLIDTKMKDISAGREMKVPETPDVVSQISGSKPRSYPLFAAKDQQQLLAQLQFAKENGLSGVIWQTNSKVLKSEVDQFINNTLDDLERGMVFVQIVQR